MFVFLVIQNSRNVPIEFGMHFDKSDNTPEPTTAVRILFSNLINSKGPVWVSTQNSGTLHKIEEEIKCVLVRHQHNTVVCRTGPVIVSGKHDPEKKAGGMLVAGNDEQTFEVRKGWYTITIRGDSRKKQSKVLMENSERHTDRTHGFEIYVLGSELLFRTV